MYCQSNNWWRFRKILWPSQNIWTLSDQDLSLDPWHSGYSFLDQLKKFIIFLFYFSVQERFDYWFENPYQCRPTQLGQSFQGTPDPEKRQNHSILLWISSARKDSQVKMWRIWIWLSQRKLLKVSSLIHFDPFWSDLFWSDPKKNVKTMFILMVNVTNFGFDYRKEKLFKNEENEKKVSFFWREKIDKMHNIPRCFTTLLSTAWIPPNLIQTWPSRRYLYPPSPPKTTVDVYSYVCVWYIIII